MEAFSATGCISYGWDMFKRRPWFFIGAIFVYLLVPSVINSILQEIGHSNTFVGILMAIASFAVQIFASMGMTNFILKAHDDIARVEIGDLWHPAPFWTYLGA